MSLRLSSRRRSGSRQIHRGRKKARQVQVQCKVHVNYFFRHPRHFPQGIRTPWSNRQWPFLLWSFEAAERGHSAQTSRQVEEKQLVSPPWQHARSHNSLFDNFWLPKTLQWFSTPYSPDQAPCDFFLFRKMKLRLKGRRFDTTEEIHVETQEVIDTLTFENFQECIKSWQTRRDRCIHTQADYFEGDGGH